MRVPFNQPWVSGKEQAYVLDAIASRNIITGGPYGNRCEQWLQQRTGARRALMTHSCTAALEMIAMLLDIRPGDEVIMPSFTFSSTANAFVLRGAIPVFVDIRPDTLNIDETLIEAAITPRTRAIVVVHYAGVGCEMDAVMAIAEAHGLYVVEDAAQALLADYKGRPLGSFGHLAALSFHSAKNVGCGEGGALLINDARFEDAAEVIHDKGVNRRQFLAGRIKRYTWMDMGLSSAISDLSCAYLLAQLEHADDVTTARRQLWEEYDRTLASQDHASPLQRSQAPAHCRHNGHIFFVALDSPLRRDRLQALLAARGIGAASHYEPLHSAPAGRRFGRCSGDLRHTESIPARLLRLPLWPGLPPGTIAEAAEAVAEACQAD